MTGPAPLHELAGRRILVTGASSGIGAAAAIAFGGSGALVVVHYHANAAGAEATCAAIRKAGGRAFPLGKNLAAREAGAALVEESATLLGGLDLLVNNAGDMIERRPLADVGDAQLDRVIDLNIRPVVSACAAAIPLLKGPTPGSIINVTSISARSGGSLGSNLYGAAKSFVATYTRGLARELAPDRIRVNAIAPGVIETPLHARHTPPDVLAQLAATIPLRRVGQPDDCVGAFLFLACETMSGYMTGQTIEVNGGQYMA